MNNNLSEEEEEDQQNTTIKQLDYSDIPKYSTILVVASRRSGKSVFSRDLVYKEFIKKRKIKNFVIVSPTIHNGDYAFLDDKYKFTEFNEQFLNTILENQQKQILEDPKSPYIDLVLVLDDIIKSTNSNTKDCLSRLFTLSRHYRIYCILAVQSLKHECTPTIRFNSDLVVVFKTKNYLNKQEITETWLGFSTKEERDQGLAVIDEVAQGYRAMVINNVIHSNKLDDLITYTQVDINKSVPKDFFLY